MVCEVVMVFEARGGVSERVWCISSQMDSTWRAGRCAIAQQTVTYLFKLGSDKFDAVPQALGPAPQRQDVWLPLEPSTITNRL